MAIDRKLQTALALGGGLCLCLYWRSWHDGPHLFYDVPAALAMCAYIAQIICEARARQFSVSLSLRAMLMIPMSVIPAGRDFFAWPISGHLSDILAVALIQSRDQRLSKWQRGAYYLPLPIILYLRWFQLDRDGHADTFHALLAAGAMFAAYLLGLAAWQAKSLRQQPPAP